MSGTKGQADDEDENKFQCEKCGKIITLNSMMPVFKKGFSRPDGTPHIPLDVLLSGGWLGKALEGMACPKCGHMLALASPPGRRGKGRGKRRVWLPLIK